MADTKVSALTALTGANLAIGDLLNIVDISDTSMAASGTNKQISTLELFAGLQNIGRLPVIVIKTGDQSNSSNTTLADVTDLAFTVVAGGIYVFEFFLFTVSAATTTGLVVSINGPTIGAGIIKYFYHAPTSATATFHGGATAYETALIATGCISTTVPQMSTVTGVFFAGATGGTLQLRMRSEISASNATIQLGSWGRMARLA